MKKLRSLGALLMAVIIIAGTLPAAFAKNNTYTINGKAISVDSASSSPGECWDYSSRIYRKIHGKGFTCYRDTESNILRNLSLEQSRMTPENLKKFIAAAPVGSVIRICNEKNFYSHDGGSNPGHSLILVAKNSDGSSFTVLEGGLSKSPYKREFSYTPDSLCKTYNSKYAFVKYIKNPTGACEHHFEKYLCTVCGEAGYIKQKADFFIANGKTTLTVTASSCYSKAAPAAKAGSAKLLKQGDTVIACGAVVNNSNNYWLRLEDGSYLFAEHVRSDLSFDGAKVPSSFSKKTTKMSGSGSITSDLHLVSATATVFKSGKQKISRGITVANNTAGHTVEINDLLNMVSPKALGKGSYSVKIEAKDSTGKTIAKTFNFTVK